MKDTKNRKGLYFKGYFCPEGGGLYVETSTRFFHGALPGLSRCLKASIADAGVVVEYDDEQCD